MKFFLLFMALTLAETAFCWDVEMASMARDSNGAIISAADTRWGITFTKFLDSGELDVSFGTGGVARLTVDTGDPQFHRTTALIPIEDEELLAAFSISVGPPRPFRKAIKVSRITRSGEIDTTFGSNGFISVPLNINVDGEYYNRYLEFLGVQKTQVKRFLVGGLLVDNNYKSLGFYIVRYFENGSIDESFGNSGIVVNKNLAGMALGRSSLTLDSRNRIIVASLGRSEVEKKVILTRYQENGSVDMSFGSNGTSQFSPVQELAEVGPVRTLSDDRIIVNIDTYPDGEFSPVSVVVRFLANGLIDASYGTDGLSEVLPFPEPSFIEDFSAQEDGSILACGDGIYWAGSDLDGHLARLNPDGFLDMSFGEGGLLTIKQTSIYDEHLKAVRVLDDGKIIVGGSALPNQCQDTISSGLYLARFHPGGEVDDTFNGGFVISPEHNIDSVLAPTCN